MKHDRNESVWSSTNNITTLQQQQQQQQQQQREIELIPSKDK
jgi:hypothetical protein